MPNTKRWIPCNKVAAVWPRALLVVVSVSTAAVLTLPALAADPDDAPKQNSATAASAKGASEKNDNPLHLTAERRKAAGIAVAKPTALKLAPEIEAYGRVLDPAPLVSLLAEDETARAALSASSKELARVKKLFENGANASAQAVETAEANVSRDRSAADSAHLRLVSSWGRTFGDSARLTELRAALADGAVLARIDVLPGDQPAADVNAVNVRLAGGGGRVKAEFLGVAPLADPQVQGKGFLVLIREGSFPVGAALRATLPAVGEAKDAFVVPRSAIVYHAGSAWVYELGEKDTFERKLIQIARVVNDGVAVERGIDNDDQLATTGAEELLAVELQSSSADLDERN